MNARHFLLQWALALSLWGSAIAGHAQDLNHDYYAVYSTGRPELLRAVEKYHLKPGIDFLNAKRYSLAYPEFKFILAYYPNHPSALLLMEQTCRMWRKPTCNFEDYLERAIEINPNASNTYTVQGISLARQGKLQEAIKAYQTAVRLDPNAMNAHYNLGLALVETKQYEQAREHAKRAYELGAQLPGLRKKLEEAERANANRTSPAKPK